MNTLLNFYVFIFLNISSLLFTQYIPLMEILSMITVFSYLLPSTRYLPLILILNFLKQILDACNRENPLYDFLPSICLLQNCKNFHI